MKWIITLSACLLGVLYGCNGQTNKNHMTNQTNNPLLCDVETGMCEVPGHNATTDTLHTAATDKPVKVIYYTDPICSSCWGIEPQLRRLKLEYGNAVEIAYHMGGLLPDWSYNSGGISKPSDVAHHWDEVSTYYDMPIDGDVWLEDPLSSSYPPSIAFKAATLQDEAKAIKFLRVLREMVFLQKKNITKWEHIAAAAEKAGLNVAQMKTDYEGRGKELFEADLAQGRSLGVRGFPTMIFSNGAGQQQVVYGSKPYSAYEAAIAQLYPQRKTSNYSKNWKDLFAIYPTLTAREYAELSGTPRADAEKALQALEQQGYLNRLTTKNGSLWMLK
jgi:predicted DsbA family dithiol-disulfide isomerase